MKNGEKILLWLEYLYHISFIYSCLQLSNMFMVSVGRKLFIVEQQRIEWNVFSLRFSWLAIVSKCAKDNIQTIGFSNSQLGTLLVTAAYVGLHDINCEIAATCDNNYIGPFQCFADYYGYRA